MWVSYYNKRKLCTDVSMDEKKKNNQKSYPNVVTKLQRQIADIKKDNTPNPNLTYRLMQNSLLEGVKGWNNLLVIILGKGGFPRPPSLRQDELKWHSHGLGFGCRCRPNTASRILVSVHTRHVKHCPNPTSNSVSCHMLVGLNKAKE